jgi:hypothetical protein
MGNLFFYELWNRAGDNLDESPGSENRSTRAPAQISNPGDQIVAAKNLLFFVMKGQCSNENRSSSVGQ